MAKITWHLLNPEAEYERVVAALAPRLDTLDNKRIGLFWNGKPDGGTLLVALGRELEKRSKNVQITKYDMMIATSQENIRMMAQESDAVVSGVGD